MRSRVEFAQRLLLDLRELLVQLVGAHRAEVKRQLVDIFERPPQIPAFLVSPDQCAQHVVDIPAHALGPGQQLLQSRDPDVGLAGKRFTQSLCQAKQHLGVRGRRQILRAQLSQALPRLVDSPGFEQRGVEEILELIPGQGICIGTLGSNHLSAALARGQRLLQFASGEVAMHKIGERRHFALPGGASRRRSSHRQQ